MPASKKLGEKTASKAAVTTLKKTKTRSRKAAPAVKSKTSSSKRSKTTATTTSRKGAKPSAGKVQKTPRASGPSGIKKTDSNEMDKPARKTRKKIPSQLPLDHLDL
jgi:hypothetical protein